MPHIGEGDLHAWLDGAILPDAAEGTSLLAHLEMCSACRDRLEAARHVIAEADDLLAGIEPRPRPVPSLESLRRASAAGAGGRGRRRSGPRGGWRSLERLAWAASVALALGAGWIGRQLLVERGWTDPFHVAAPEESAAVGDSRIMPPGEAARRTDEPGKVEGREPEPVDADRMAEAPVSAEEDARPRSEIAEPSKRLPDDARRLQVAPLSKGKAEAELRPGRRAAAAGDPDGCLSVEASIFDSASLPTVIELRRSPDGFDPDSRAERGLILLREGGGESGAEGWLPFADDSVWVALEIGDAVAILRVGPDAGGWKGTVEWARTAGAHPDRGGEVRLVSVPCRRADP